METKRVRQGRERGRWFFGLAGAILAGSPLSAAATVPDALPPETTEWSETMGPSADRILRERSQPLLGDPGALLRAAHKAVERRDRSHAIWLLEQLIQRHPVVADYGALLQAGWLHEEGHADRAVRVAGRALARHPNTPVAAQLYELKGNVLSSRGSREEAHAAWGLALDHSRDEELGVRVLMAIAASQERVGLDEEAAARYAEIWSAHPTTPEAPIAAHRLELLAELLGRPLLAGTDWRRRGDRLYRKRRNVEALETYDRATELGVSSSEARAIARQRARLLFRLRRYPEAAEAFAGLPLRDDVPIWHARSLARADRVPEAIAAFESLAVHGRGDLPARARFLAATLLEGRGFQERARAHYQQLAEGQRHSELVDAALWRLGWLAYRERDHEAAVRHFDRLIQSKEADEAGQLRPRYWRARALEQLGQDGAEEELVRIARGFPLSYYGWRAQNRLGTAPEMLPAAGETLREGRSGLGPDALARPLILLEAGMLPEARAEVERLAKRARSLTDRLKLAQIATDAGDYHRAQQLVTDAYSDRLDRGPIKRFEELWWFAWPPAFSLEVSEATRLDRKSTR
ncbi:MAG: tetratricopeptide repeat protein, partial [Myxococcota bacterium]